MARDIHGNVKFAGVSALILQGIGDRPTADFCACWITLEELDGLTPVRCVQDAEPRLVAFGAVPLPEGIQETGITLQARLHRANQNGRGVMG